MKNLYKTLLLVLAIPAIVASCAKEIENPKPKPEPQEVIEEEPVVTGRPVTLSAALPEETKISHIYEDNQIKPYWADGDQIKVSFTLNEVAIVETFTLQTGAGTQSATFHNENSQLEDDTPFTVDYVDANHPDGWAVQDGTLEHLPECLSANVANISTSVKLTPALTYFHVIFDDFTGGTFTSAYLNKLAGAFTMYSKPGVKGAITVTPSSAFASGPVDFYVAVKLEGNTSANGTDVFGATVSPKFQVAFGNGVQAVSPNGQAYDIAGESYKFSWSPAKGYSAGKVYKIANKAFSTTAASMPR